jgi:hypothetical protein
MGKDNAIAFDILKTELLHYLSLKSVIEATLGLPDNSIITPKEVVKWLGIYFN